ncbi:MAG TPA: autotransporter outer membrane beta-barrel domain-containing protein [Caulobacteraceae bacterium]|nr:autotransporter outer membrane beta-barrel domain-containing protein [Caulobacteraceae bacterium]
MKRHWLAVALAPLAFAAAATAHADTTISSSTKTPQTTSADGNITIDAGASIAPTAGPAAVTINSSNSVTNNGAITYTGVNDATGVLIEGGNSGNLTNAGTITVDEKTTGDSTFEGVADGPFANGSDRFGIQVEGSSAFNGGIVDSGAITVIGENSAGIQIGPGGITGDLHVSGAITVTGGNFGTTDVSYGILSAGPIGGNVTIAGAVTATGTNATGVELDGGVGGALVIQSTITATGFRSTTPPASPLVAAKLYGNQTALGGPALVVGGNVSDGIDLAAAVAASGNITATAAGVLNVFGSAPAMVIGGANPITIGTAADGFGLTVGGSIAGAGTYPNDDGVGLQIGGSNLLPVAVGGVAGDGASGPQTYGSVFVAGGILVTGNITASSISTVAGEGNAVAVHLGQGAQVPRIINTGVIEASTQEDSAPTGNITTPVTTTAIQIDKNVSFGVSIVNAGSIVAAIGPVQGVAGVTSTKGGTFGQAAAIMDQGGAVLSIMNAGNITASVTPTDATETENGTAIAFETNSNLPVLYAQCATLEGGVCALTGNGTANPVTNGQLIFNGLGAGIVDLWAGNMTGGIAFSSNENNKLDIENGAFLVGSLSQAPGGVLDLNIGGNTTGGGELYISAPVTGPVTVGNTTTTGAVPIQTSSLTIGSKGVLVAEVNPADLPSSVFEVSGNATLAKGAGVGVAMSAPITSTVDVKLIQTAPGNLTLAGGPSGVTLVQLPFLFSGTLDTSQVADGALTIEVTPKTAQQLGFNPAESSAFHAIYAALGDDPQIAREVLGKTTAAGLFGLYGQFLPDYQGGIFENMVTGQRSIARTEADPPTKLQSDGVRGWVQEIGFLEDQSSTSEVNGYRGSGQGFAAGVERARGNSAIGVAASFLTSAVRDNAQLADQSLTSSAFEGGVYWRTGGGGSGLVASASINGGWMFMGSRRFVIDQDSAGVVSLYRQAKANWSGWIASADVGLGYQITMGRMYARPEVFADYIYMSQSGYVERGGGNGVNLAIASQTSTEGDVQADIVLGANFGQSIIWRPEVTVGYHAVVTGGPSTTNAKFVVSNGGGNFVLTPVVDKGGILARLGLHAGGQFADFTADAGGEFRGSYQTYDARAMARFLF